MTKIYYALYDLQCHNIMHTGKNDTTLEDLKDSLLSYLSGDRDDQEMSELEKMNTQELAEMFEFEILIQNKAFSEVEYD